MTRQAISPRLAIRREENTAPPSASAPRRGALFEESGDSPPAPPRRRAPGRWSPPSPPSAPRPRGRPENAVDQPLRFRLRHGRSFREQCRQALVARSISRSGATTSWTRPRRSASAASNRSPVRNQPPGPARSDRGDHIGADHRRHQAEPHLGEAEGGTLGGKRDVAGGDQTDAAAIGGTLHGRDRRLGQAVERVEQAGEARARRPRFPARRPRPSAASSRGRRRRRSSCRRPRAARCARRRGGRVDRAPSSARRSSPRRRRCAARAGQASRSPRRPHRPYRDSRSAIPRLTSGTGRSGSVRSARSARPRAQPQDHPAFRPDR